MPEDRSIAVGKLELVGGVLRMRDGGPPITIATPSDLGALALAIHPAATQFTAVHLGEKPSCRPWYGADGGQILPSRDVSDALFAYSQSEGRGRAALKAAIAFSSWILLASVVAASSIRSDFDQSDAVLCRYFLRRARMCVRVPGAAGMVPSVERPTSGLQAAAPAEAAPLPLSVDCPEHIAASCDSLVRASVALAMDMAVTPGAVVLTDRSAHVRLNRAHLPDKARAELAEIDEAAASRGGVSSETVRTGSFLVHRRASGQHSTWRPVSTGTPDFRTLGIAVKPERPKPPAAAAA